MLIKIVPKHLNKIEKYLASKYLEFREKHVEIFK